MIGLAATVAALVVRPSILAEYLRPDGVFGGGVVERSTIAQACSWGVLVLGVVMVLLGIVKATGSNFAHRIEHAAKEVGALRLKLPRVAITMIFVVFALLLLNKAVYLALNDDAWKPVIGYEYQWIADSLAGGHGYSLPASHRWYFLDFVSEYPADEYYATALEEPIYPFLLGYSQKVFGEYGRLAVLLLHLVALYLTALFIYLVVRKVFDSRLGVVASIALLTLWWYHIRWLTLGVFSPAVLGGLAIICSAYLLLWSMEKVSVKRVVILGFALAVSCLTLAAGLIMVPLAASLIALSPRPARPFAWRPAIALVVTFGAILSPWTLRNYLVFGQLIPIRTGFGLALHQSNPALAATFSNVPHTCVEELGPIWRAKSPKDAIDQVRTNQAKRIAMYKRSYDCIESEAPPDYSTFNEAQRDKVYLRKSIEFIAANPRTFLELARYRIQAFLVGWSSHHTRVTLLAFLGAVMTWRNRRALVLVLLVAAYSFTFSLTTSLMYRYRYPIEPILFVLSMGAPITILSMLRSYIGGSRAPTKLPTV